MTASERANTAPPALLVVVALLVEVPEHGLVCGQVGTVVEALDRSTSLVEFADDRGRGHALVPCIHADLLILRSLPEMA